MSSAEILSLISTICFVIAAVSFVFAVFFWFYYGILSVIGDLSGRTAKKSIAKMRASNEKSRGQGYRPSATNVNRGKLTGLMPQAGESGKKPQKTQAKPAQKAAKVPREELMPETGLLASNRVESIDTKETDLLQDTDSTQLLLDEEATAPLHEEPVITAKRTGGVKLTMLDEVMLIHTDEVIQ